MAKDYRFYCSICWQTFDDPAQHNRGSVLSTDTGRHRLNGYCPGDIRPTDPMSTREKRHRPQKETLPLWSAEPLRIR